MCAALALQERGVSVTVADPGDMQGQASWGNAGRIAVELSEPLASVSTLVSLPGTLFSLGGPVAFPVSAIANWLPFGLRLVAASSPRRFARGKEALGLLLSKALPAWRRRLQTIDASPLLRETGHYSVWENPRRGASGREAWRRNSGAASTCDLDVSEWERLRGVIGVPIAEALKFVGTASIADTTELLGALRDAYLQRGGSFRKSIIGIAEAEEAADAVVVAAGVGSASLLQALGHTVPMIAERGYHIEQPCTTWPGDLPPLFFEDRAVVLTKFRSALRATSFVEFTTQDAAPDTRNWARLRQHLVELGLPIDGRATEWIGSRPTLPDYLPAIGRSRRQQNIYYAFGHQHLGLTLGALTGDLVAALVTNGEAEIDLQAFDLDRFAF